MSGGFASCSGLIRRPTSRLGTGARAGPFCRAGAAPSLSAPVRAPRGCFWCKAMVMTWCQTITQAKQHPSAPLTYTLYLCCTSNLFISLIQTRSKDETWRRLVDLAVCFNCYLSASPVTCRNLQKHAPRRVF